MVRLFVGCRNGYAEPNALGYCCHGAYDSQRLVDRPLRTRDFRSIEITIVDIIASKYVSHEDTMDLGFFKQLRKLYPVLDVVELMRVIIRMSPQAW